MKRRLRAGENIRFTVKYDFDLAKAHYPTVLSGISYFEITVSVSSTLAVSNIRNRTYTNYEVYLIGYGYGKFKEKIHFME